jgi:hypothetical protein
MIKIYTVASDSDYERKLFASDEPRKSPTPQRAFYLETRNADLERQAARYQVERCRFLTHIATLRDSIDPTHDQMDALKVRFLKASKQRDDYKRRALKAEAQLRYALKSTTKAIP